MRNVSIAAIVVFALGFMAQPASSVEHPQIQLAGNDEPVAPQRPTIQLAGNDEPVAPQRPTIQLAGNDEPVAPQRPTTQLANVDSTLGSRFLMA